MGLLEAMQTHKNKNHMVLFWDIETLAYNKKQGRHKPTKYKNITYSLAIGWNNNGKIDVEVFSSFDAFFKKFYEYSYRSDTITKSKTKIHMIAHNCNKYDNHFLLKELRYTFDNLKTENLYMKNALDNQNTVNMKEAKIMAKEENVVLEKRVKSSVNLDLTMFLKGFKFVIIDNFMKTNTSIDVLGKKLKDSGYLTDDELKTDFDYEVFDVEEDMTDTQAFAYAYECFKQLDKEQMTYIRNDVIILGQCYVHYSDIFPNFDYSKMTFSVNILDSYLTTSLAYFQLLNQIEKNQISLTDYQFDHMNLYDYIKGFYRGGLNMYNTKYLSQVIDEPCFSIDLNSSYPYVMYHEKIPTFLKDFQSFEVSTLVDTDIDNDTFTLYKVSKHEMNKIINRIPSRVLRKMIVKYYNNDVTVNINTNTLRLIRDVGGVEIHQIRVLSYLSFDCEYFGSRDVIYDNYFIKTQGKLKNIIQMDSPYNYHITEQPNPNPYSDEEVALSKVVLNGLYGIPALRSHFNLFRYNEEGELENQINGYKNSERNILFSTFVTSQALYNLLEPLKHLTHKQVDDCFIYCDTDSLYLKSDVKHLLPKSMFDSIALGKWDVENDTIEKMFVLNHKKYTYLADNQIHVASAGIPLKAFNTNQSFEHFIENEFHHGATVYNMKSILNEQGKISIYPSKTDIEEGDDYPILFSVWLDKLKEDLFERVRQDFIATGNANDLLYIESSIGSFSISDIFPHYEPYEDRKHIKYLYNIHKTIQNNIKK